MSDSKISELAAKAYDGTMTEVTLDEFCNAVWASKYPGTREYVRVPYDKGEATGVYACIWRHYPPTKGVPRLHKADVILGPNAPCCADHAAEFFSIGYMAVRSLTHKGRALIDKWVEEAKPHALQLKDYLELRGDWNQEEL